MPYRKTINLILLLLLVISFSISAHNGDECHLPMSHKYDYLYKKTRGLETTDYDYESLPGSEYVIFLDFDGAKVTNGIWRPMGVDTIHALDAYYFDSDERIQIARMVAADFQPFDVNITTKQEVYDAAEGPKKVQVIFTPTNFFRPGVLGVAEKFTFQWKYSPEAWVFTPHLQTAAVAASHEIGHTLWLNHDGFSGGAYYPGHGDWCPIMGSTGSRHMAQWSNGDYPTANNSQGDVSIISERIPFREDKWGSSLEAPSTLSEITDAGGNISETALIHNRKDKDIFLFSTSGGNINIDFGCADEGWYNNLRIEAAILDINGNVIARAETDKKNTNLSTNLSQGTYYLQFDGIGYLTPATGYSDYGSLGDYHFSGTVPPLNSVAEIGITEINEMSAITCDETVISQVTVENFGDLDQSGFTLLFSNTNGPLHTEWIAETLPAGESRTYEVEFTPNNFMDFSYEVELQTGSDLKSSNNFISSNTTKYYHGEELIFQTLKSGSHFDTKWTIESNYNQSLIIDDQTYPEVLSNDTSTQHFCLPKDSCFNLTITQPFKTSWCDQPEYSQYDPWYQDMEYIFQPGDTVLLWANDGQALFEVLEEIDFWDMMAGAEYNESKLREISCPLPNDIDPFFAFIKPETDEEIIFESYTTEHSEFTYNFCPSDITTSNEEVAKRGSELLLYPNPATDVIIIKGLKENTSAFIYDTQGRIVRTIPNNESRIDISSLSSGVYVVQSKKQTIRFIKK